MPECAVILGWRSGNTALGRKWGGQHGWNGECEGDRVWKGEGGEQPRVSA